MQNYFLTAYYLITNHFPYIIFTIIIESSRIFLKNWYRSTLSREIAVCHLLLLISYHRNWSDRINPIYIYIQDNFAKLQLCISISRVYLPLYSRQIRNWFVSFFLLVFCMAHLRVENVCLFEYNECRYICWLDELFTHPE